MCPPSSTQDSTHIHVWIQDHAQNGDVITADGLDNIAAHKYKPGHSTRLDNLLNDGWNVLTELLPLWLAPNMVTTIGGLLVFLGYALIWTMSPNWDEEVPSWALAFSGTCIIIYYTLDCMDGKQARRTGTSSPLGQLFDHGVDCISCMLQFGTVGAFTLSGGGKRILALQSSTQFTFFIAQWEEYYTHVLEHAQGEYIGVTEVNYGMGIATIVHSLIDCKAFWHSPVREMIPVSLLQNIGLKIPDWVLVSTRLEVGSVIWVGLMIQCLLASIRRVYIHVGGMNRTFLSAVAKLISPILLQVAFIVPSHITASNTRYVSIAMGSLFCLISIKVIVYSMAKMSYAAVQKELIPYIAMCVWFRYDNSISAAGSRLCLLIVSLWNVLCLLSWTRTAVLQVCDRLDIFCFTIKPKLKVQ